MIVNNAWLAERKKKPAGSRPVGFANAATMNHGTNT